MLLETFVIGFRKIASEMDAPTFLSLLGGLGHEQGNGEHILAFPALGRIKDLVHNVPLPESDDLLGLQERLIPSSDTDISPHERSKRISDVGRIQTSAVRMRDLVFYQRMFEVGGTRPCALRDDPAGYSAEHQPFEKRIAAESICAMQAG